jgi:hypothetical protein
MPLRAFAILLPFLSLVILSLAVHGTREGIARRRFSFLIAATCLGAYLVVVTEILGRFRLLNFHAIFAVWMIALLVSIVMLLRTPVKGLIPANRPDSLSFFVVFAACCLIVAAVGLIAIVAPPNHWDVLAYHMSRVVHWQQNASVDHYPTHIVRQLRMTPFAEYGMLHLQILAGSDRFANVIQWLGYSGSAIAASILAAQIGAPRGGQLLSAVFVLTLPIAIIQGSVAKNDCVISFWYLASFCFFFVFKQHGRLIQGIMLGAALGLSILTKGTSYIFALPLVTWIGLWAIAKYRWQAWKILVLIGGVIVLLNLSFWTRNYDLFGGPLGPNFETPASVADPTFSRRNAPARLTYENRVMTPALFVSNVLRNGAVHAVTPIGFVNTSVHNAILGIHDFMGTDPVDPDTTWHYSRFKPQKRISYDDTTGSPVHLILAVIGLIYWLTKYRSDRDLFWIAFVVLTSFLLFCSLLRWHHTIGRLHLPLFLLSSVLVGALFSRGLRSAWWTYGISGVLILCAIPWLIYNESRPLIGNESILYTSRFEQYRAQRNIRVFESATQFMSSELK